MIEIRGFGKIQKWKKGKRALVDLSLLHFIGSIIHVFLFHSTASHIKYTDCRTNLAVPQDIRWEAFQDQQWKKKDVGSHNESPQIFYPFKQFTFYTSTSQQYWTFPISIKIFSNISTIGIVVPLPYTVGIYVALRKCVQKQTSKR